MGEVILQSKGWEKGGEEDRQKHLMATMEAAGLEVEKAEPPEPPAELNENLTPQHVTAYVTQIKEAKKAHKDWDQLFTSLEKNDINIGKAAQEAILKLKNGTEVSYYLARHPDYARRLGKKPVTEAVAEVGRLSGRLMPEARFVRPAENAGFDEIVKTPNYWGKARDIRRALRRHR
jgi:hypothetical protein